MRLRCSQIAATGPSAYKLSLQLNDDTDVHDIEFKVVMVHDIEVVSASLDFGEMLGRQMIPAAPLYAAVLAFHRARDLTWTPVPVTVDE